MVHGCMCDILVIHLDFKNVWLIKDIDINVFY